MAVSPYLAGMTEHQQSEFEEGSSRNWEAKQPFQACNLIQIQSHQFQIQILALLLRLRKNNRELRFGTQYKTEIRLRRIDDKII
jgi:hypothetical protein